MQPCRASLSGQMRAQAVSIGEAVFGRCLGFVWRNNTIVVIHNPLLR